MRRRQERPFAIHWPPFVKDRLRANRVIAFHPQGGERRSPGIDGGCHRLLGIHIVHPLAWHRGLAG